MINLKTKKIVIPYDFSETAENAVKHAAFIASITKGEIILLNVQKKSELLSLIMPALNIKKASVITDFLKDKLAKDAIRIEKKYGVKTKAIFSSGNITSEIVSVCEKQKADLLVMGTQGSDSHNDVFMGSNTYRTLTKSDLPILTVRTSPAKKGYSCIVLPIDLSAHTRQKVVVAIQLAKLFKGHLHLVGLYNDSEESHKFKLDVYLKQIVTECKKNKIESSSEIIKTDNKVKKTIEYCVKVHADVIISMTDQDVEFKSVMLGKYIHQLINYSKTPILCIPPEINDDFEGGAAGLPF